MHGETRLLHFPRKNNYGEETEILRGELTPTDLHLSIAIQPSMERGRRILKMTQLKWVARGNYSNIEGKLNPTHQNTRAEEGEKESVCKDLQIESISTTEEFYKISLSLLRVPWACVKRDAYPQLYTTLRIKLMPVLWSTIGRKHSSISERATAILELHSTLPSKSRTVSGASSWLHWIILHANSGSRSFLTARRFCNSSNSCIA